MTIERNDSNLQDQKLNVKVKLALFWVALMFLFVYNDILSMYQPGHVSDLVEGHIEGVIFTPSMLIGAALLMALPSFMILFSLVLKASWSRIANIGVGIFQIVVLIGTQFIGDSETWTYWRLNELFELVFMVLIIRTAWEWPRVES